MSRSQAGYHTDEEAIVAGGTVVTPSGRDAVVVRLDHDGTYHPGFGTGGRVVVDLGRAVDRVVGIQVGLPPPPGGDPGVAIVVVGDDGADMVSITLDNIGQLSNPPGGGRRVVDFSVSSELAEDFVVQPDGAVVVVASGSQGVAVMRLLPDGRLDPTFGQGGVVVEPGGTATSVALQADGKILVGGSRGMRGHGVYRFLADGRLDVDFGNYLGFSSVDGQSRETVVAQRPDGHIVVGTHNVAILSPSGQLETERSVGSNRAVVGLAVEPGGAVVAVTGPIYDGSTTGPLAMRILVDGTRDPDFPGSAGVTPAAIVRHPDGRFFVAGEIVTERTPGGVPSKVDVGVAAMTPDGQLDDTFGAGPSERVVAVAAGSYHSLFLFGSGEIRTAGWNAFGQLGHGDSNRLAPSGVVDSGSLAGKYVAIAGGGLTASASGPTGRSGPGATTSSASSATAPRPTARRP